MFKHYVKVALRLIKRSFLFSSVNMLGFVLWMTAAFLIYLWIVDELTFWLSAIPTGNLDSVNGNEVMNLLMELNREGMTVVMVTHSEENARMAGRLIRMIDGNILTESRK